MSTAVGGPASPIVDDVVANIQSAGELGRILSKPARQAPVSSGAVGKKVVMETADIPADARGVPAG